MKSSARNRLIKQSTLTFEKTRQTELCFVLTEKVLRVDFLKTDKTTKTTEARKLRLKNLNS